MNQKVEFDFEDLFERDEQGTKPKKRTDLSRNEIAEWLIGKGLSKLETEVVLLKGLDRKSLREISRAVRVGKTKIGEILKLSGIRELLGELKSAQLTGVSPVVLSVDLATPSDQSGKNLAEIREWAKCELSPFSEEFEDTTLTEWAHMKRESEWLRSRDHAIFFSLDFSHVSPSNRDIVRVVRSFPALLLRPEGRPILEALVDLLEGAHFGISAGRRLQGLSLGKRNRVRQLATKFLASLFKPKPGSAYPFLDLAYGWVVHAYGYRIFFLQREWAKSLGQPIPGRLDRFRLSFPQDVAGFTTGKLRSMLSGQPVRVAAKLAEADTGVSAHLLEKGYLKRFRDFDPFAPAVRAAGKTPGG